MAAGHGVAADGDGHVKRGPGARAGRRDYSQLPRVRGGLGFPGRRVLLPGVRGAVPPLGDHWSGEQLDWQVIVRLVAHCRRRYRRACSCRVPATVMAPGPPKAIGKGLFTNGFTAMLLTERLRRGGAMNSLVTGLAAAGRGDLACDAGGDVRAGRVAARAAGGRDRGAGTRDSWHLHADETTWRVFCPGDGDGPATLVALGVHRPGHRVLRHGSLPLRAVLARHAGIDEETGQLTAGEDGGPRRLVISSDEPV